MTNVVTLPKWNQKRALITGFPGQDACYLAEFLLDKNYEVYGVMKRYTSPNWDNINYLDLADRVHWITADVTDIGSLFYALDEAKPHEFYNLAAQSFVGDSWKLTHATTAVDALGPLNCLEAIQRTDTRIKFYQAGTSEMFGNANTDGVQTEHTPFMPVSPYGVAKLYGYHITRNFRESFGAYACTGILFNHESPIRGKQFVTRKITDAAAQISRCRVTGDDPQKLVLGNLSARRDWGHARDYVRAMWLMLQQSEPDDFIIATGENHSVKDVVDIAFDEAGIKSWKHHVEVSTAFMRPNELHNLKASCTKAKDVLGWEPEITFEQMIREMVQEDYKRAI